MKVKTKVVLSTILASLIVTFFASCGNKAGTSSTTGWKYNNPENGGFETQPDYQGQQTGPGLVLIEGGAFTMGQVEQDVMFDWNNVLRRVTMASFYMDETEIRNEDYREYLYWLNRVYVDYPQVYTEALPDTLVWRRKLAYNEPYVEYYFRHPAYRDYPVVGVSWVQADAYCSWRTDRVNEQILVDQQILEVNPNQTNEENFNTDAYLAGQYEGIVKKLMPDPGHPDNPDGRPVKMEDGILLPKYRLPTEAQWEYAALGLIGNTVEERVFNRKLYPWNGHYLRNDEKDFRGEFRANFQRGKGDLMGIAGGLNDAASITAPVTAYWPNDYGLYNMSGNVNEWVRDVYRAMSSMDVHEFRPFRGNIFKTPLTNMSGELAEKDSLGRMRQRPVSAEESRDRFNYQKADNINYLDGDVASSIAEGGDWVKADETPKDETTQTGANRLGSTRMYSQGDGLGKNALGMTSLITDQSRVFKGGSWRDRTYWLGPATRRFLDEDLCTDDIGFRCAMIRVGSPAGN